MTFEWEVKPMGTWLSATQGFINLFMIVDLTAFVFSVFFYSFYFFQLDSYHYAIFLLIAFHSWTWVALLMLSGTGHGGNFERFAGMIMSTAFAADLFALTVKILAVVLVGNPVASRTFAVITWVITPTLLAISIGEVALILSFQNGASKHRVDFERHLKDELGSNALVENIRTTHRRLLKKKRALRVISGATAVIFVVSLIIFIVQLFVLRGATPSYWSMEAKFMIALMVQFPHFFGWIVTYSLAGARHTYPPEAMSTVGEVRLVSIGYWVVTLAIAAGAIVSIILNFSLPLVAPGFLATAHQYLFWYLWVLTAVSGGLTFMSSIAASWIVADMDAEVLADRREAKEHVKRAWNSYTSDSDVETPKRMIEDDEDEDEDEDDEGIRQRKKKKKQSRIEEEEEVTRRERPLIYEGRDVYAGFETGLWRKIMAGDDFAEINEMRRNGAKIKLVDEVGRDLSGAFAREGMPRR